MNMELQQLLTSLEEVNAQALDRSDPTLHDSIDMLHIQALLCERGKLIEQLPSMLAAATPVSYSEWNRIVVAHDQGSRIQENIEQARNRLVVELSASCSARVFLDRMTAILR